MDGRYHCPVKDAQRLGLDDPRVSKDALRKAYLREAKKAHPDAGGSAASFRGEVAAMFGGDFTRRHPLGCSASTLRGNLWMGNL